MERQLEPWEEMQRQGQDLADRLAQGFNGLLHSHIAPPKLTNPFDHQILVPTNWNLALPLAVGHSASNGGVSAIFDIGNKLGQAGSELGNCINGAVQQFFRHVPLPFLKVEVRKIDGGSEEGRIVVDRETGRVEGAYGGSVFGVDELGEEDGIDFDLKSAPNFGRPQVSWVLVVYYCVHESAS